MSHGENRCSVFSEPSIGAGHQPVFVFGDEPHLLIFGGEPHLLVHGTGAGDEPRLLVFGVGKESVINSGDESGPLSGEKGLGFQSNSFDAIGLYPTFLLDRVFLGRERL